MTMSVIKQGAEPVTFKAYFVAWEPQMWNKKMSYEDQVRAIKQDNEIVDENAWTLVWPALKGLSLRMRKRRWRINEARV